MSTFRVKKPDRLKPDSRNGQWRGLLACDLLKAQSSIADSPSVVFECRLCRDCPLCRLPCPHILLFVYSTSIYTAYPSLDTLQPLHRPEPLGVSPQVRAHWRPRIRQRTRQRFPVLKDMDAAAVVQKDGEDDGEVPYLERDEPVVLWERRAGHT